MKSTTLPLSIALAVAAIQTTIAGDEITSASSKVLADKSVYHLFKPVPPALLRELSTDRPDKTESPYTVDAGHIQIESDLVAYSRDHHTGTTEQSHSHSFSTLNVKFGLLNNVDLQIVLEPHNRSHTREEGSREIQRSGFGDIIIRTKINLWGNDEGATAFAVMPFVKLPTNQDAMGNESVEGGFIAPLAIALPYDWSLGLMAEIDIMENSDFDGIHLEFIQSVTVSRPIVGDLSGYVEIFTLVSAEDATEWQATLDAGLTYAFSENVQWDAGINIGLTQAAEDLNPFVGFSVRF